jgi:hypothetical protein
MEQRLVRGCKSLLHLCIAAVAAYMRASIGILASESSRITQTENKMPERRPGILKISRKSCRAKSLQEAPH